MALNYYRSDGWVKTVQGPAVPGAQVYVLNQPANVVPPITPPRTTPVPFVPNPQAQIYSDAGSTPIVQPIITDGFGHYDFYVLPGLYTVAIYYGGKLQQFYVDQSIGNVGSTLAPSTLFLTNGTPNFNQSIQNLVQGAGITIITDNFGNTVLTATGGGGSGPVLETDGVINGDQALLNLKSGSGINITDDGVGGVTIKAAAVASGTAVVPLAFTIFAGETGVDFFPATIVCRVPGSTLISFPSSSKVSISVVAHAGSVTATLTNCVLARTAINSLTVLDYTPVTWGGTQNPVLPLGTNTSDAINLQLDPNHDYWFLFFSPLISGNDYQLVCSSNGGCIEGGRSKATGGGGGGADFTSTNPLPSDLLSLFDQVPLLSWVAA